MKKTSGVGGLVLEEVKKTMIQKIWAWLDGKKSYIAAGVAGLVTAALYLNLIDLKTAEIITGFATAVLGVVIRLTIASKTPNA